MTHLLHLLSAATLSLGAPDCDQAIRTRLEQRLRPMLQQRAESGSFSGVVLVACKGQPLFSAAYGDANRAKGQKNTLDTRFNLGSMNKMWTAVAIAQLVEQRKVDIEATVGTYLPDLSNAQLRDSVRIRHLLTHTSGLGTYFKRGYLRDRVAITRAEQLGRFFMDDSLSFTPGSRSQYSNAGFAVLGMIVEKVSGVSYFEYVRRNVIERAGMSGADFITLPLPTGNFATGYATPPGESVQENTEFVERSSTPAGGAYANAASIVAFSRALWSGKLVAPSIVQQFTSGKVEMMGVKYAFGFGESFTNGWRSVGHNGGAPGVGADFRSFPEYDIDIVVLTNVDMPEATVVMNAAAAAVTGGPEPRMNVPGRARGDSTAQRLPPRVDFNPYP
jgi:CubicO group peptidase (beta-lactamase class C family)